MWTLLTDPLGRALLHLLTTDYGMPGAPRRRVLLHELQDLHAKAEGQDAPAQVKAAIRTALRTLRAEFPDGYSAAPAVRTTAGGGTELISLVACRSS
jgi:hypothetical protein